MDAILLAQEPDAYWSDVCELVVPLGGIVTIVDARGSLDVEPAETEERPLRLGVHVSPAPCSAWTWNARAESCAPPPGWWKKASCRPPSESLGPINAANLKEAHRRIESGKTIGKLVLAG